MPGVGSVTWNGRPQGWRGTAACPVFWLNWSPGPAMPQPVLTVWAVPPADRAGIRAWADVTAMPAMRTWVRAAEQATPTWRDARHAVAWNWTEQTAARENGRP
jgi:hypothetical protein